MTTFVVEAQAKRPPVSASTFFNRQPLYLRPDPSRVVVRPFRLASEPRGTSTRPTRDAPTISWVGCSRRLIEEVGGRNKLAALLGVSGPYLGRVLSGEKPVTIQVVERRDMISWPIG
jgi:hypothetical protein